MNNYKLRQGSYPEKIKETTDKEYVGKGWSVKEEGNKFYFCFVSGSLQGMYKEVEISNDDYIKARNGQLSFNELCRKYE